jgi:hypothetical protein
MVDAFQAYLLSGSYPYNSYNYSTARVAKGDFIRLKTVSLTYLVPQSFTKRIGFSNASLALSGNNLVLLYSDKNLKGQDPEFFNTGGVAQPIQRQITLSLKVAL